LTLPLAAPAAIAIFFSGNAGDAIADFGNHRQYAWP